jgi:peroxiredoxin
MMQISTQQDEKFTLLADKENRVTPASSVDMGEKLMGQIVKYHIISNFPQERICVC